MRQDSEWFEHVSERAVSYLLILDIPGRIDLQWSFRVQGICLKNALDILDAGGEEMR